MTYDCKRKNLCDLPKKDNLCDKYGVARESEEDSDHEGPKMYHNLVQVCVCFIIKPVLKTLKCAIC